MICGLQEETHATGSDSDQIILNVTVLQRYNYHPNFVLNGAPASSIAVNSKRFKHNAVQHARQEITPYVKVKYRLHSRVHSLLFHNCSMAEVVQERHSASYVSKKVTNSDDQTVTKPVLGMYSKQKTPFPRTQVCKDAWR